MEAGSASDLKRGMPCIWWCTLVQRLLMGKSNAQMLPYARGTFVEVKTSLVINGARTLILAHSVRFCCKCFTITITIV